MNMQRMRKYIYFSALKISNEKIYSIFCFNVVDI
ncbi:hypothetical protein SAMN05421800_12827 [Chryseobacterium balustinum]|uniref:Uncharacterized protein n=1 Tax=Chryseobacterium balustinum TaxID=246 RepID=A0AAX2IG17_9FLAO|nr:hypothetical protein SAMN05421800_12827 [Chryseobacterium balustinum]SQA87553.1 Uncharacterised protein [Chryseobacterium balustinum]